MAPKCCLWALHLRFSKASTDHGFLVAWQFDVAWIRILDSQHQHHIGQPTKKTHHGGDRDGSFKPPIDSDDTGGLFIVVFTRLPYKRPPGFVEVWHVKNIKKPRCGEVEV